MLSISAAAAIGPWQRARRSRFIEGSFSPSLLSEVLPRDTTVHIFLRLPTACGLGVTLLSLVSARSFIYYWQFERRCQQVISINIRYYHSHRLLSSQWADTRVCPYFCIQVFDIPGRNLQLATRHLIPHASRLFPQRSAPHPCSLTPSPSFQSLVPAPELSSTACKSITQS